MTFTEFLAATTVNSCCRETDRNGVVTYNYPGRAGHTCADHVATGHGSWSFTTERGVKVEMGRSTHRPGYGIVYATRPGFYN